MRHHAALFTLLAAASLHAESAPAPAPAKAAPAPVPAKQAPLEHSEAEQVRAWERNSTAAIIANIDGRPITTNDIWNELGPIMISLRQQARNMQEYVELVSEQRDKVRDNLTDKYLILSETKEKGMSLPASVVQEQIDEKITKDYNGDRNEYFRTLRLKGRTPLDERKEMEEDILVTIATNQIRKTVAELSPEKIQRYYEANKDAFSQPAGIKLSQIVLWPGAADTDDDVRKLAATVLERLDKGDSFADVAKKYSKDDSREQGGETAWRNMSELNAQILKVMEGLNDGQHTKAIEFMVGGRLNVYIYRRDASRVEGPRPVAEVREIIEGKLLADTTKAVREEWMRRLRQHYFVRYYNDQQVSR